MRKGIVGIAQDAMFVDEDIIFILETIKYWKLSDKLGENSVFVLVYSLMFNLLISHVFIQQKKNRYK